MIKPPLTDFQIRAKAVLKETRLKYLAGLMGSGKTRIILETSAELNQPILVVAPLLVALDVWKEENAKWTPHRTIGIMHGPNKLGVFMSNPDIKVINFSGLIWLRNQLLEYGYRDFTKRALIIDEGAQLRRHNSKKFLALKSMRPLFVRNGIVPMSGTPMPNGYLDLWPQYFMVDGGEALFDNFYDYQDRYFKLPPYKKFGWEPIKGAEEDIQEKVKPLTIMVKPEEMKPIPYTETNLYIQLSSTIMEMYNELEEEAILDLQKYNSAAAMIIVAMQPGSKMMKLRQLVQGAMYSEFGYEVVHDEKINALKEIIERAQRSPVLVPIAFKYEADSLRRCIDKKFPIIAGGVPTKERMKYIEAWKKGELPYMGVHPASVSHGMNLQAGGHIIAWLGMTYDLEQYDQLNGRLIRQGQTKTVSLQRIICKGTIDERIANVLSNKDRTQQDFVNALLAV